MVTAALGGEGPERVVAEVADLWFHSLVLLSSRGIPLRRVLAELARRHAGRPEPEAPHERRRARGHVPARPARRLRLLGATVSSAASSTPRRGTR